MVGYDKTETLSPNQKLYASILAAMVSRVITNPLEVVKIRTQLQDKAMKNPSRQWFQITRIIYKETGLKSFWRGHRVGQIQSIVIVSTQLYVYELSTRLVANSMIDNKFKPTLHFLCGMLAGFVCAAFGHPFDVIRARQMISKGKMKGLIRGAKKVYQSGGILAFYEGISAALVEVVPQIAISLATYRVVQAFILNLLDDCDEPNCIHGKGYSRKPQHLAVSSAVAGATAGFVAKSLTYPLELTKKRLLIQSHSRSGQTDLFRCRSLSDCFIKTFQQEGIHGFFRGYQISLLKAPLQGLVTFTSYELFCYIARDMVITINRENESLTQQQKIIAGVATRFITQPLDVVKLRTQLQKSKRVKLSFPSILKSILTEEGLRGFFQGHLLGQIHSVTAVSAQFFFYEISTAFLLPIFQSDSNYIPITRFFCGIFAGCMATFFVNPLEVIRVRQMLTKEHYGGLLRATKTVYQHGGILAFYEGLGASLLQMGPQVGVAFGAFSIMQPMILNYLACGQTYGCPVLPGNNPYSAKDLLIASSIAGSISGFFAKTVSYPLDLTKRRLQIASHPKGFDNVPSTAKHLQRCHTITHCLKTAYRKDGVRGLFQGWLVTTMKGQVTNVVAFTTYELICFALREL